MTKGDELSISGAILYITATGDRTRIGTGGVEGQTSRVAIGNGGRIKFADSSANADFIVGHTLSGVRGSGYLEVQPGGVLDLGSNGQLMVGETGNGVAQFSNGAGADISGNLILASNSNTGASLLVDGSEISIGGTIVLSGFEGFEGVLGSHGNKYHIFQNFSQLSALGVAIAGYDTENWTAVINDSGELVFTAIPEPATIALLLGILAIGLVVRRR